MMNTPTTTLPWTEAGNLVKAASKIILVTHVFPDGDAIGSLMGLTHALRDNGKQVTPLVDGGTPAHLQFIPGSSAVLSEPNGLADLGADLVITLDASDIPRTGEVGKAALALGLPVIMIDHHPTNPQFGTVNLLNVVAPATAEIVLDWLDEMTFPLSQETAFCLLTGIVTDTLCFRISSVTSDTLGKAHRLMAAGASLSAITQRTVSRRSTAAFRLWAHVMPTIRIEDHVMWVRVDQAAREAAGIADEDSDGGLSALLIEADEAYISATFRETKDGRVELSFRAVPGFNVAQVAFSLGGGGHILAAGATVDGTLDDVEARVLPMLKAAAEVGSPVLL